MNSDAHGRRSHCVRCGWPISEQHVHSRHRSSLGTVHYQTCVCGARVLLVDGEVLACR